MLVVNTIASQIVGQMPYERSANMVGHGRRAMTSLPPSKVWAHPSLTTSVSDIEGTGIFTTTDLPAGVIVLQLGGRLVRAEELNGLFEKAAEADRYIDTIQVTGDEHLVLPPRTIAHYGNHCCQPNLWHSGPYDLGTRRFIPAGEELTLDYGTSSTLSDFRMNCRCNAPTCRNVITGNDWQLASLRDRYGTHWVPAVLSLIENLIPEKEQT